MFVHKDMFTFPKYASILQNAYICIYLHPNTIDICRHTITSIKIYECTLIHAHIFTGTFTPLTILVEYWLVLCSSKHHKLLHNKLLSISSYSLFFLYIVFVLFVHSLLSFFLYKISSIIVN